MIAAEKTDYILPDSNCAIVYIDFDKPLSLIITAFGASAHFLFELTYLGLACVAGVQRGGRGGGVECEREARRECEARSLGARREKQVPYERPTIALRARIQLPPSLAFVRRLTLGGRSKDFI